MPVILDRLPLPNITWYTGISVLCLLCSVYYAGVQVKIHPDWKEQLLQRNAMASAGGGRGAKDEFRYHDKGNGDPLPLHWGVFNSNDQDEEGYCRLENRQKADMLDDFSNLTQERNQVCIKEDFEDVLRAAFYDEMCYIRYGSLDVAFSNYMNHNVARRALGKSPYLPIEYTRRCQQAARKLAHKYNTSNAVANAINLNLKRKTQDWRSTEDQAASGGNVSSESSDGNSGQSVPDKKPHKQLHEQPPAKAPLNQCTTDTFYDSYERAIDGEVSLYHIPLYDSGCDDMERELSPYLIPEIISFMFHEPLCIWTLINMAYCVLILLGTTIQHMVFGELRVSEQQHIKDKFWNFVFYKFIFVFGVMNVKHMDEAVLWCSWFSVLGFLHLLDQLCKDRFEYLSFSGYTGRRTHIRLLCLLGIILLVATACLVISVLVGCHAGINTFAFMAAECVLLIVRTLYVITRYSIYLWDITHQGLWEKRGGYVYATELVFELSELTIDMVHHIHMLVWGNIMLTMASLVICMQLRLLFYQLQHKVKTHRNYLRVRKLLARYPEVQHPLSLEQEGITCAICWESVAKGRRLPCTHVFHTDCLLAWLPQHLSCPTCRHRLRPAAASPSAIESGGLTFLSRLFSRRSSDPLDASNSVASGNNSGASNTSSRNNSRNASEHNTPQHASVDASSTLAGLSSAGAFREQERALASHSLARPLEERLVISSSVASNGGDAEAAVSHDGVTASFVYHNSDEDLLDEMVDEKPPKAGDNDDDDELQHSSRGENANGFGGGSDSLLLDHGSVFWGGSDHHHRRHHHHGRAGAGGEGGRYVSWLSSFSVEQRHTQLRPQLNVTPSAESSLHSMALQVQQMFPHMEYADIISDLRRTRSIMSTVDNILEDNLSTSPPRTSSYTPLSSSPSSCSGTWPSSPSAATTSSNGQQRGPQTTSQQLRSAAAAGSVPPTDSVKDRRSGRASTSAASRSSPSQTPPKSVLTTASLPEVEQCNVLKACVSKALQEGLRSAASVVSSSSSAVNLSQAMLTNNTVSPQQQQAQHSVSACDPECSLPLSAISICTSPCGEQLSCNPMPDYTTHFGLRSARETELEVQSESFASTTCQVHKNQVATEKTISSVGPQTASRALDGTGQSSVVGTGPLSLGSGCCDVGKPTVYPATGSYTSVHKKAVETFEDPRSVQQYDVNESNGLIGIYDLGSDGGDEKYKQILQETSEESVLNFENISYDDDCSVAELSSNSRETSLKRRAVQKEDDESSTRGEWPLEEAHRDQWNNCCRGQSSDEEESIMKHSSSMAQIRLEPGQGGAFSPTTHLTREASITRITTGDQGTAAFGNSEDTTQRRLRKTGDVVVESARGASMLTVGSFGGRFSKNPSERESLLLGRQQLLYSTARNRLLKSASSSGIGLCATDGAPRAILDSISAPAYTASAVYSDSFGGAVIKRTWEQVTGDSVVLRDVSTGNGATDDSIVLCGVSSCNGVTGNSVALRDISSCNGVTGDTDTDNR